MMRRVLCLTAAYLVFVTLLTVCSDHLHPSNGTTTAATSNRRQALKPITAGGEDNNVPPVSAYKQKFVCLDESFTHDDVSICTAQDLITFTNEDIPADTSTGFRYQDEGPTVTQGVFWLSELAGSDSLVTFAGTPRVGGYVSRGFLQRDPQGFHYRLRNRGDRTWAYADKDFIGVDSGWDSTLLFQLVRGTIDAPEKFAVDALRNLGVLPFRIYFAWLFRLFNYNTMELITDPSHPKKIEFPDSEVWHRKSVLLFIFPVLDYYAVQIVDGGGNKIHDAYAAWVAYQQSGIAGSDPNWNHFDYLPEDYTR